MEGYVKLECTIEQVDDGELELFYRVTNEMDCPILLLSTLPRPEASWVRGAPDRVYAYVDPDGILQLTKRLWPVPSGVQIFSREVPFASEVWPTRRFEERLLLPKPIPIDYPYRFLEFEELAAKSEDVVAQAEGVAFSIGYLVKADGSVGSEVKDGESRASRALAYGMAAKHQRILQGATMHMAVLVKDVKR